jgi:hypothetical protein
LNLSLCALSVGPLSHQRLGLPLAVAGPTLWRLLEKQPADGLRQTMKAQVQAVLRDPSTPRLAFPLGVGVEF